MMSRFMCLVGLMLCVCTTAHAKVFEPKYPDFFEHHLKQSTYSIDTTAKAVVLYEKVYYRLYQSGAIHRYVKRIVKILTEGGKEYADINISGFYNEYALIQNKKGWGKTYNLDGEQIKTTVLDPKVSKIEVGDNYRVTFKFSMPDVRVGSIIEYEYILDEPANYIFGLWKFQEDLPKLYSEVEVNADYRLRYSDLSMSAQPFKDFDDSKNFANTETPDAYYTTFLEGDIRHRRWVRKNIAAFKDEPYTSNSENYKEKILFQSSVHTFFNVFFSSSISWKTMNGWFLNNDHFLNELKQPNTGLKMLVQSTTSATYDSLQIAKNIFKYVRDSFTNNTFGIKHDQTLQSMLGTKRGSILKINEVLIGMLQVAGIKSEPVLISPTTQMKLRESMPMPDLVEYMATKAVIAGKEYLLDPTSKYAPFGVLSPLCYNDYTRVVDKDSGYAIHLLPKLLVNKDVLLVNTVNADPQNYLLQYKHFYGNVAGPQNRQLWTTDTSTLRSYIIKGLPSGFELQNFAVQNLANVDTVLILEYTVKAPWTTNMVYMPVVLKQFYSSNPFVAEERHYPIEFPYARDDVYSINLQAPAGYSFADSATSTTYRFDDNTGLKYNASYDAGRKLLQVNAHLSFKETQFTTQDYKYLKNFFNDVLNVQQTVYAFKKQ